METFKGEPLSIFQELSQQYDIVAIFSNRDYEPKGITRDQEIASWSDTRGIEFLQFKDQVIFDRAEVTKSDGSPYTVYTPYAKKWKANLAASPHLACPKTATHHNYYQQPPKEILSIDEIGFEKTDCRFVAPDLNATRIAQYDQTRDFPAVKGTTQIGMALRFGTISVRECVN